MILGWGALNRKTAERRGEEHAAQRSRHDHFQHLIVVIVLELLAVVVTQTLVLAAGDGHRRNKCMNRVSPISVLNILESGWQLQ